MSDNTAHERIAAVLADMRIKAESWWHDGWRPFTARLFASAVAHWVQELADALGASTASTGTPESTEGVTPRAAQRKGGTPNG